MDKIICFGKNYQDHILELGDKSVIKPVIFLKPPSVLKQCVNWDEKIEAFFPKNETHYECELVIRLGMGGYNLTLDQAAKSISAYTVGLDMTLRQEQMVLKQNGHPWTISKVFPDSCIIGPWIEVFDMKFMDEIFRFSLNHHLKQKSCANNMLFKPVDLIVYASQFFPLCEGSSNPSWYYKRSVGKSWQ